MANRRDWSADEVDAVVADYLYMLTLDLSGQHYVKSHHRQRLKARLANRSDGSIEFKHQNISAVLMELGWPFIPGYKPAFNYQHLLFDRVRQRLANAEKLDKSAAAASQQPATAPILSSYEHLEAQAPVASSVGQREATPKYEPPDHAIKRDYLAMEARNQSLGKAGEELIASYEQFRLHKAGKRTLSERVEHIASTQGDGLGYDILSFDRDGRERLIEVKTTAFGKITPFYLTRQELALSHDAQQQFHLYRVFNFRKKPQFFDLSGAVDERCLLNPKNYLATF